MVSSPMVRSNLASPRAASYQMLAPGLPAVATRQAPTPIVQYLPPSPTMVAMPASVLTHIDNVVTEMERELNEIRACEQRQEASDIRHGTLEEIRRIVAEKLLSNGSDEEELRRVKAEVNRLGLLEADHMALKKQVSDLELQRSSAEREREELCRIRAALELECESRLRELKAAAEALDAEKRRELQIEESANERVMQAALEAKSLQEQLLEAEVTIERDKLIMKENASSQGALEAAESDLKLLEDNSRAVLNDCRCLQAKLKDMESERVVITTRITELDIENGDLKARIDALEREIQEHHAEHHHHHHKIKIHIEKTEALEAEKDEHSRKATDLMKALADRDSQIQEHMSGHDEHRRKHSLNGHRIAELEQFAQDLQDKHSQNDSKHRSCIDDLQKRLRDFEAENDSHKRQHSTYRQQIKDLEEARMHAETQQGARKNSEVGRHLSKIQELEQQLLDTQGAHDGHARKVKSHEAKISDLERELEESRRNIENHQRTHATNRSKLAEMEQRLLEHESHNEKHSRRHTINTSKIGNLESELENLAAEKSRHEKMHGTNKSRIQELEEELANAHREHSGRHTKNELRIKELLEHHELNSLGSQELERRVTELMQQLAASQADLADSRAELEETRKLCRQLQLDAENTVAKHNELLLSRTQEYELKLQQLQQANMSASVTFTEKTSSPRPSVQSRQSVSMRKARQTLVGDLIKHDYLVGALLPSSNDEFVAKVREATINVGDALKSANDAHANCIKLQIAILWDGEDSSRLIQDAALDSSDRATIETERRAAYDLVDAAVCELRALEMELPTQHSLPEYDKRELTARLSLDINKCNEELELLKLDADLGTSGVPDDVLLMLVRVQDSGPTVAWDGGFSPMHWAAKYGRRDIMEYLLRVPDGKLLLSTRDTHGRAPLWYARSSKKDALAHWLQQEVDGGNVMAIETSGRPEDAIASLPPQYLNVLAKIEQHGWAAMNWKDGFTMLHWAAGKNNIEICQHLITLGGDVNGLDGNNRSPITIATDKGFSDLVTVLKTYGKQRKSFFPMQR